MKFNFRYSDDLLKKQFKKTHPFDLAELYPYLSEEDKKRMLRLVDISKKSDIFVTIQLIPRKKWDTEVTELFEFNRFVKNRKNGK